MKRIPYILFLAIGSVISFLAQGQDADQMIQIPVPQWLEIKNSTLSRDSILVGEQVVWSTRITLPQEQEIMFVPYGKIVEVERAPIDVIHDLKVDTVSIKNGVKELEAKMLLTSFDSGYYKLPLMVAMTPQGDTIFLDSPFLDVTNTPVDTASFEMHPLKGQARYPLTFKELLPWSLLSLLVIVLGYLLYRYIKYRKENRGFFGKPAVADPPHIRALRELDKLRNEKLWQNGKEKLYYTGITDTLREYIEARYGVSAMEQTSSEIMGELKGKCVDEKCYRELDELFRTADLVKFAKYIPQIHENEEAIPVAVRFVNSTFEQELQQENQKGEEK